LGGYGKVSAVNMLIAGTLPSHFHQVSTSYTREIFTTASLRLSGLRISKGCPSVMTRSILHMSGDTLVTNHVLLVVTAMPRSMSGLPVQALVLLVVVIQVTLLSVLIAITVPGLSWLKSIDCGWTVMVPRLGVLIPHSFSWGG
jgi:hypothetical protein